jgi:outer membrane protein OmpA-like peptidoglycan-associated protein
MQLFKHSNCMKKTIASVLTVSMVFFGLGCSLLPSKKNSTEAPVVEAPKPNNGIDTSQRALPTLSTTVVQPAHYQHVYIDTANPNAGSIQTITLDDAIKSEVLASNELQAKPLKLDQKSMAWLVLDRDFSRPTELEGVGGEMAQANAFAEVNFALNKAEVLNPERVLKLAELAKRLSGAFNVIGYADESGLDIPNTKLANDRAAAVAELLVANGVNSSRITATGAGISRAYPTLEANRRASIAYRVIE